MIVITLSSIVLWLSHCPLTEMILGYNPFDCISLLSNLINSLPTHCEKARLFINLLIQNTAEYHKDLKSFLERSFLCLILNSVFGIFNDFGFLVWSIGVVLDFVTEY